MKKEVRQKIEENLGKAILEAGQVMNETDTRNAQSLLLNGEYGEALLLICTQLYEFDSIIDRGLFERLKELAKLMEIDQNEWGFVEGLVRPE